MFFFLENCSAILKKRALSKVGRIVFMFPPQRVKRETKISEKKKIKKIREALILHLSPHHSPFGGEHLIPETNDNRGQRNIRSREEMGV